MSSRQPFVYLAGPMAKGDKWDNLTVPSRLFKLLIERGIYSFVPQWCLPISPMLQLDYEQWMEFDFQIIRRCDGLIRLPGESAGADREVTLAQELELPVFHMQGGWSLDKLTDVVANYFGLR
jgi:hypothetical protein